MSSDDERRAVLDVVERLSGRVPAKVREQVATVVRDVHRELDDARIRDFVPILVERESRVRLDQLV